MRRKHASPHRTCTNLETALNNLFLFSQMSVPDTTSQRHHPVVESQGLVAVDLGDAAQAFGPADGVFHLHTATGVAGTCLLRRGLRWGKLSGATS